MRIFYTLNARRGAWCDSVNAPRSTPHVFPRLRCERILESQADGSMVFGGFLIILVPGRIPVMVERLYRGIFGKEMVQILVIPVNFPGGSIHDYFQLGLIIIPLGGKVRFPFFPEHFPDQIV